MNFLHFPSCHLLQFPSFFNACSALLSPKPKPSEYIIPFHVPVHCPVSVPSILTLICISLSMTQLTLLQSATTPHLPKHFISNVIYFRFPQFLRPTRNSKYNYLSPGMLYSSL